MEILGHNATVIGLAFAGFSSRGVMVRGEDATLIGIHTRNTCSYGIYIDDTAARATVGAAGPAGTMVATQCYKGIQLEAPNVRVVNALIGLDVDGFDSGKPSAGGTGNTGYGLQIGPTSGESKAANVQIGALGDENRVVVSGNGLAASTSKALKMRRWSTRLWARTTRVGPRYQTLAAMATDQADSAWGRCRPER